MLARNSLLHIRSACISTVCPVSLAWSCCRRSALCCGLPRRRTQPRSFAPKYLSSQPIETGQDRGDVPGELQYWVERQKLDTAVPVPGLEHALLTNGRGLYAMVSGTTSRCAVQMMALAMNPSFDLTHTYILLSGIGGANPATLTVGSAVWVRQVIDGDPAFEIDSREIPAEWPYGTIALGATEPGKVPANVEHAPAAGVSENGSGGVGKIVYDLNPALGRLGLRSNQANRTRRFTRTKASRARFTDDPIALQPPKWLRETASAQTASGTEPS